MSNRNAVLVGLAAACTLFVCLVTATRLDALAALVLAIVGGGVVAVAFSRLRPAGRKAPPVPVTLAAPPPPAPPLPLTFQARPITGIRLPSAFTDYDFVFAASVLWLPAADGVAAAEEIAVNDIIRRAHQITGQRVPGQAAVIVPELTMALGVLQSDPSGNVQARAESVYLQLLPEDQHRLDELASLRKEEGLWEYQRQHQVSRRRYLHTDVLKDPGSAVVWWLAKHEDQPQQVADSIDVLTRLAHAANNGDDAPLDAAAGAPSAAPQSPAECFDAFLDSFDPELSADVRLTLTDVVARLVDADHQKSADEMRRRHSAPGNDAPSRYWDDYTATGEDPTE
jgi:hypothetical protein